MYSLIWMKRKVVPSSSVVTNPSCIPRRLPLRIDSSAQCMVKLDETRIAVLTPATATGSSNPSGGHGPSLETTRRKK
jgi:hypothetical protein